MVVATKIAITVMFMETSLVAIHHVSSWSFWSSGNCDAE